jgi:hypothetical protein
MSQIGKLLDDIRETESVADRLGSAIAERPEDEILRINAYALERRREDLIDRINHYLGVTQSQGLRPA